jgi:hypothetical protein
LNGQHQIIASECLPPSHMADFQMSVRVVVKMELLHF